MLQIEERAEYLRKMLLRDDIKNIMRERCEEQGHGYENCCSGTAHEIRLNHS